MSDIVKHCTSFRSLHEKKHLSHRVRFTWTTTTGFLSEPRQTYALCVCDWCLKNFTETSSSSLGEKQWRRFPLPQTWSGPICAPSPHTQCRIKVGRFDAAALGPFKKSAHGHGRKKEKSSILVVISLVGTISGESSKL